MSEPVLHDVQNTFLAGHGRAAAGNAIQNLDALLEIGGSSSSPAASPAAPAAPAAAAPAGAAATPDGPQPTDDVPFGTRILNAIKAAPAAAAKQFTGDIAGSWDKLRSDYLASIPDAEKYQKASFWDRAKMQFNEQVSAGKSIVDAFNLVMSPISSALDVATTGVSEGAQAAAPSVFHAKALKEALDRSLIGLGPEGGLSKVAGVAKAGEAAAAATEGAAGAATEAAKSAAASPPRDYLFGEQKPDAAGRLRVTDADKAMTVDYLSGKIPDNPIQASLETLSTPEGSREIIKNVARFIPEGAVKSDDVTLMGAYSLQRSPEEILSGLRTVLPSDEEIVAWKMTMDAAGRELKTAADGYAADPTPENFDQASRAFTLALKITKQWDEAGTEQGRAFRARATETGAGDAEFFGKGLREILANIGPDNVEEAIRKVGALEDPAKVPAWLSLLRRMKSRDGLVYGWYNILLSNVPKTLSKKLFGDGFAGAWQIATRGMSEMTGSVAGGSTQQLLYGYVSGFGDAMRAAGKALRAGESQFHADYQTVEGNYKSHSGEIAKGMDDSRIGSPTSAALGYLRAALPTTWIGAADDFAKVFHYNAAKRMLAYVDASKGGAFDAQRFSDLMNNLPDGMHEQAVSYAIKNSYQEPLTGFAADMAAAVDKANIPVAGTGTAAPFGRIIMPFIKIPTNLARFAYRASPLPLAFPTEAFKAEIAAGGSRAAIARAGVGLGTGFALTAATLAAADRLTGMGPSEPDERRFWLATHQPYSVKYGDKWYGYQGGHPLGLMLGPVADTVDIMRFAHDKDAEDAALSLAFGIGHALLSPTFMLSASDFLEAINDPSQDARYFFDNLAASASPTSMQGPRAIDNAIDPWRRAHYGALETVRANTPGLSQSLPPARTIWGDPIPRAAGWIPGVGDGGAMGRAFSPVPMKDADAGAQPIDKWIWDNRAAFPRGDEGKLGLTPPGRIFSFDAGGVSARVQLEPKQLDRLKVLAGNELKDPQTKLGAKDALNALVEGKYPNALMQQQWNKGSAELRAVMVQRVWAKYRDRARLALLAEDKGLQDKVALQLGGRREDLQKQNSAGAAPTFGGP